MTQILYGKIFFYGSYVSFFGFTFEEFGLKALRISGNLRLGEEIGNITDIELYWCLMWCPGQNKRIAILSFFLNVVNGD
jgi:hypothetical protein